jgi:hypothetical protein
VRRQALVSVLTVIVVALAAALMLYLLRCYVRERQIRKRVARRVHQPYGGNIVPPEVVFIGTENTPRPARKKSTVILRPNQWDNAAVKHRRRTHGPHPWKQDRFRRESPTPH